MKRGSLVYTIHTIQTQKKGFTGITEPQAGIEWNGIVSECLKIVCMQVKLLTGT